MSFSLMLKNIFKLATKSCFILIILIPWSIYISHVHPSVSEIRPNPPSVPSSPTPSLALVIGFYLFFQQGTPTSGNGISSVAQRLCWRYPCVLLSPVEFFAVFRALANLVRAKQSRAELSGAKIIKRVESCRL